MNIMTLEPKVKKSKSVGIISIKEQKIISEAKGVCFDCDLTTDEIKDIEEKLEEINR